MSAKQAAAASRTSSFAWPSAKPNTASEAPCFAAAPTLLPEEVKTDPKALSMVICTSLLCAFSSTPAPAAADPAAPALEFPHAWACKSATNGSTRGVRSMSWPKASAAGCRTADDGSLSAFTKDFWSCGTNGFCAAPPLSSSSSNAWRIAAFTGPGNLSPTTRIKGPVIFTRKGFRHGCPVQRTKSPIPSAQHSRWLEVPLRRPCWYRASSGSIPFGTLNKGSRNPPKAPDDDPAPSLSWCSKNCSHPLRCRTSDTKLTTLFRRKSTWGSSSSRGRLFTRAVKQSRTASSTPRFLSTKSLTKSLRNMGTSSK
mmetsp:Transcript_38218/g.65068  ORF Transcript_38218/g.65068 Transcript_38218/m.65068 type:complete len:312 (-) Transcript_38218:69-1004(-)